MVDEIFISIVIPVLNEEESIEELPLEIDQEDVANTFEEIVEETIVPDEVVLEITEQGEVEISEDDLVIEEAEIETVEEPIAIAPEDQVSIEEIVEVLNEA